MQIMSTGWPAWLTASAATALLATSGAGAAHAGEMPRDTDTAGLPSTPPAIIEPAIQPLRDALAPRIDAARERFGIPAVSLALVRGDQVLWTEGFGDADPQLGRRASADTLYRAGSLAKPFTALATLALAQTGRVDIDAPLSTSLPAFGIGSRFQGAEAITPRMLLSHHSGLPSDLHKGLWSDTPFTAVTTQLRDELAAFPPQLVFSYSNVGYTLLGHLVQRVTAEPFPVHLQRTLFGPLGMDATRIASLPAQAEALAVGHRGGRALAPLPIRDLPAQGLQTSARDLGRFLVALLCGGALHGRQVLAPGVLEAMLMPQNQDVPLDLDVTTGLGWLLEDTRSPEAGVLVRHSGTTLGHTAELMLLPDAGLGIAVLANSGDGRRVVEQLANAILAQAESLAPEPLPPDLFLSASDGSASIGTPTSAGGHFATDLGLITIEQSADEARHTLCACMTGTQLDLVRAPDGWLDVPATEQALAPTAQTLAAMRYQTRHIGGREVVVAETGDGEAVIGEKVPAEPLPARWQARLGRYAVINPDPGYPVSDLRLSLTDGKLCFSYRMPLLSDKRIQMPVRPLNADTGVILGLGRNRGDALRFVERAGASPLLRWSGYLARPIGSAEAGASENDNAEMTSLK